MRRAARRDDNEQEIAKALLLAGCSVDYIDNEGTPDLLVGRANRNYMLEVKARDGRLTQAQIVWHRDWRGQKAIVRTVDEALRAVGL